MTKRFFAASAAIGAMLISALPAQAGVTPWLDRDNPGGTGDWETTETLIAKVQCALVATGQSTVGMPGYTCDSKGSACRNNPRVACKDTKVRFVFDDKRGHTATTPWMDRDNPSGDGDFELTNLLFTVKCKYTDTNAAMTTGGAYRCSSPDVMAGGSGVNALNGGQSVRNIAVQFSY